MNSSEKLSSSLTKPVIDGVFLKETLKALKNDISTYATYATKKLATSGGSMKRRKSLRKTRKNK
jgi:hypothetical protein